MKKIVISSVALATTFDGKEIYTERITEIKCNRTSTKGVK